MIEYSSTIDGNYPLLANAIIKDELGLDFPLIASFPKIFSLEKQEELTQFIKESQVAGFDWEQFDVLYQATFEAIQALRNSYTFSLLSEVRSAATVNRITPYLKDIYVDQFVDWGLQEQGATFSSQVAQIIDLPNCNKGPETCSVKLDILVSVTFPTANPGSFPSDGDAKAEDLTEAKASGGWVAPHKDAHLHFTRFTVSNAIASLDLAKNPDDTFILNFDHLWQSNEEAAFGTMATLTSTGQNTITTSNIAGVFVNTYTDNEGVERKVKITGSVIGAISTLQFFANFSSVRPEDIATSFNFTDIRNVFSVFEHSNSIATPMTLDAGTVSGFMEGADLQIKLETESVK